MPSPLDWLGVTPAPQTSLMTPAVSPYRSYGLTSADAVRQGTQALGNLQAAASYADLLRQQALAPLQQQVAQNQLQNQLDTQPRVSEGRDVLVQTISALDPTRDDYLARRRDAVMINPYGLADPIVQEVLRTNDRAYDDYISTKRLSAYGEPRSLTPSQQASIQHQMSRVTESLGKAQAIGDAAMVSRYTQELQSLGALLSGAPSPAAPVSPAAGAHAESALETPRPNISGPEPMRWQSTKEALLGAVNKEAASLGVPVADVMSLVEQDEEFAKDFFQRHLGAEPSASAFKADRPWYASSAVSWGDVFKALQGDQKMLQGVDTIPREARGLPPSTPVSTGNWKFAPKQ